MKQPRNTLGIGLRGLLGRILVAGNQRARRQGVEITFASMQDLVAVNRANLDSWRPLLPIFDPDKSDLSDKTTFCMLGRNPDGEVVLAQAARFFDWRSTTFTKEAESLRLFYRDPEAMRGPDEAILVSAPMGHNIQGRVVYTGAHWVRPDYRGKGLTGITPRMARALAIARWNIGIACTIMAKDIWDKRVARRAGYFNSDWTVQLNNTPTGTFPAALLWSWRPDILADLANHLHEPRETIGTHSEQ